MFLSDCTILSHIGKALIKSMAEVYFLYLIVLDQLFWFFTKVEDEFSYGNFSSGLNVVVLQKCKIRNKLNNINKLEKN